jgi:hypothetical protein
MVPADARSINFLVAPNQDDGVVSLNGVPIPLVSIGGGRLAGDVSSFAGTTARLSFSTPDIGGYPGQRFYFDDIQFSPSSIPEPTTCSLLVISIALFGWRLTRSNQVTGANSRPSSLFKSRGLRRRALVVESRWRYHGGAAVAQF